ncbi:MAG TPA: DUF4142 domain-containing protein, partial [Chitinophagaceae bacterium]
MDDHKQLLTQLEKLNGDRNDVDKLTDEAANKIQDVPYSNLSGSEFDRAWVRDMITGHTKTINEYQRELSKVKNIEVRNMIKKSLSLASGHIRQLEALGMM